jgi:hypothetical protein
MTVFWVVAPCSLVEVYQRFRCPWCQGNYPDDGGSKDSETLVNCVSLRCYYDRNGLGKKQSCTVSLVWDS